MVGSPGKVAPRGRFGGACTPSILPRSKPRQQKASSPRNRSTVRGSRLCWLGCSGRRHLERWSYSPRNPKTLTSVVTNDQRIDHVLRDAVRGQPGKQPAERRTGASEQTQGSAPKRKRLPCVGTGTPRRSPLSEERRRVLTKQSRAPRMCCRSRSFVHRVSLRWRVVN